MHVNRALPFLLCALSLMLASCAIFRPATVASKPSRVDCAIFEGPAIAKPVIPLGSKDIVLWQLYGVGMEAYAESLLGQRVESAACVVKYNHEQGLQ